MQEQDEQLELVSGSIRVLKDMSERIGDELDEQAVWVYAHTKFYINKSPFDTTGDLCITLGFVSSCMKSQTPVPTWICLLAQTVSM